MGTVVWFFNKLLAVSYPFQREGDSEMPNIRIVFFTADGIENQKTFSGEDFAKAQAFMYALVANEVRFNVDYF